MTGEIQGLLLGCSVDRQAQMTAHGLSCCWCVLGSPGSSVEEGKRKTSLVSFKDLSLACWVVNKVMDMIKDPEFGRAGFMRGHSGGL